MPFWYYMWWSKCKFHHIFPWIMISTDACTVRKCIHMIQLSKYIITKCFVSGVRQFWVYVLSLPLTSNVTLECSAPVPRSIKPSGIVMRCREDDRAKPPYHTWHMVHSDSSVSSLEWGQHKTGFISAGYLFWKYTQEMCLKHFEEWKMNI